MSKETIKAVILLGILLTLLFCMHHHMMVMGPPDQRPLKGLCYIHSVSNNSDGDHLSKVIEALEYGAIVRCQRYEHHEIEVIEHYVLFVDFPKEYSRADCSVYDNFGAPHK